MGGHQLAVGYLNRPEQTAATFISTPYGRLYRTGDKARLLLDGTLECLGRLSDGQVKLRGQRLELGEVQQAILRAPGCHGAVVVVQDSILVAFCSTDPGVSESTIFQECGKWLPQYMIPGEIVLMEAFPRLPSGKVDKRTLIAQFVESKQDDEIDTEELADVPADFASIVSKILTIPVHSRTPLSGSNLDSLSSIRLSSSLRAAGFNASIGTILAAQSVGDLWALLQNAPDTLSGQWGVPDISLRSEWQAIISESPSLERLSDVLEDILPCTTLQSTMLYETLQSPSLYWNQVELEVDAETQAVSSALQQAVRSNEILRTKFTLSRGAFVSLVLKDLDDGWLRIVENFEPLQAQGTSEDAHSALLDTLRVQIRRPREGEKTRMLVHIHHAIYDGWSMDILRADLSTILQGLQLPERPQFRSVIEFSQAAKQDDNINAQARAFWADHLHGWTKTPFPQLLDQAIEGDATRVADAFIPISPSRLEALSSKLAYSTQTWFQAALTIAWSGILGSQDVVLGSVTSGRTIPVPGVDKIVGPCIASLPVRVSLDSMTEVSHVLNHIQATNSTILELLPLPQSDIRKFTDLQPGDTLYDVLFVYQQSPEGGPSDRNVVKERRHQDSLETKLLIEVEPRQDGFGVQITHRLSSLSASMIECLIEQFKEVFQTILDSPQGTLASLGRSLSARPSVHNHPPAQFSGTPDLALMVESTVAAYPDHVALGFATPGPDGSLELESVSYDELNRLSNRIAHYLLAQGTQPNSVVGIIMEKSVMLYASILAIVKSGCAYLPILPTTPAGRVKSIFEQAGVKHCAVDDTLPITALEDGSVQFIPIEEAGFSVFDDHNPRCEVDGSSLAYVIYTSGTTGAPKGVAVTQLNITSNISNLAQLYPSGTPGQSRFLQSCSQAFDVSVFEIFFTWHMGMCLCSGTNDTLFDDLEQTIRELNVTHLSLTPTVASLIDPSTVPLVEFLVTAGEPLTQAVLDKWDRKLWQGYGPSETTNICSVKRMTRGMPVQHLGFTLPNTSVVVQHPDGGGILPIGWVGEFWFGGDQVAHGYLNLDTLTTNSFVNHAQFGRLYKSGDMGRMLPDGSMVILGRVDDQLKLRGQRINPQEINSVITSGDVATAAVTMIGKRTSTSPEQLIAFYVPAEGASGDGVLAADEKSTRLLFSIAQSNLPPYMVPSYLIPIARIPLTSSGKWHKAALQEWLRDLDTSYLDSVAPTPQDTEDGGSEWSVTETLVSEAIIESMHVPTSDVTRWTPFPNFGIDSLTAIGLVQLLGKKLGQRIPVSLVIQNATIAQLGRAIDDHMGPAPSTNILEMFPKSFIEAVHADFTRNAKPVESILPCTPLQEAMLSGGQRSYYNKVLLRLQIPHAEMRSYWEEMAKRHEILRTCFVTTVDATHSMAQVVLQEWSLPWLSFDVNTPSFDEVVTEHLNSLPVPVDSKEPPVSLAVLRYRDSSFLSFICHHALYDGMAMSNLWREIESLANGISLPPPVPYAPFLQEVVNLPRDTERFWRSKLQGFTPQRLFPSSSVAKFDQAIHTKTLGMPLGELYGRLKTQGASLLSLCQASWANTASVAYDCSDICFGNVVSGRNVGVDGVEKLVAPCFNTIPLRADIAKVAHGGSLIKHFYQLNSEAMKYQFTPLRLAQRVANLQGKGLFESLLLLQNPLDGMDDRLWILESDSGDMDIPLVCEVVPCPSLDSLVVNMHYDMHVMDPSTASGITELFEHILGSIVKTPFAALINRAALPSEISNGLDALRPRAEKSKSFESERKSVESWSPVEEKIRQIFSELSGRSIAKIRRSTAIYQLGLDSINAVQLASILRSQGLDVSAAEVIECPTCERLAEITSGRTVEATQTTNSSYDFKAFSEAVAGAVHAQVPAGLEIETILPSTPMQCALMTAFTQSGGQNYLNSITYEFSSGYTAEDAAVAWKRVWSHHPMLRTALVPCSRADSAFAMVTYSPDTMSSPVTSFDSEDTDDGTVDGLLEETRKNFLLQPYVPPWHVAIYQRGGRLQMKLLIHHALYDAQSLEGILKCYAQAISNKGLDQVAEIQPALATILSQSLGGNAAAESFWRGLSDMAVVNKFPVMTPLRETRETLSVESLQSSISLNALREASGDAGYSIQAVIQASWVRLLSSYLGEAAVIFGMTYSGRTDEHTANAPFPCVLTLPVVATDSRSNAELLGRMMELNSKIHKHGDVPLGQIQKWLGHPASPVFDTLVSFRKGSQDSGLTSPFTMVAEDVKIDYPVSLDIETIDGSDTITFTLTHRLDILPKEQAALMLRQFDATVESLSFSPKATSDEALQRNAPNLFSHLPPEIPHMESPVEYLHQFVELKARTQPDAVALEYADALGESYASNKKSWTYREFDGMGNRVAHLVSQSAKPGSIVAIHFGKCPEAYFAILGILKAGCSFVALDPTAPGARKTFILQDSDAPCILTGLEDALDLEGDTAAKVVRISEESIMQLSSSQLDLGDAITPQSTCYCLYTSGTTGTPKGCEITHENAVQAMMAFQDLFSGHWDTESRWLQFAALHFDVSVLEQYWSWSVGITVVAAPKDVILDDLTGAINQLGITHIDLTPSLARLTHPDDVPSLCKGVFITGGESLKQEILDAWGPKAVIYNAYGPTEATIGVTMYQRVPVNGRPSSIGKQFLNVGSYVLQPGSETPVFKGAVGELCVTGKLVGKGYLNRPELTAKCFPHMEASGERMYRTGDLVRVLHDGCFDFLGRADDQVKLRGQRLEIGEINHAIRGTPGVADAATIVATHGPGDKSVLVSFFVSENMSRQSDGLELLRDEHSLGLDAKEACRSRLPGYMVPTYFLCISYIPLSVNNKAEVKKLKVLFSELSHTQLMAMVTSSSTSASNVNPEIQRITIGALSEFSGLQEIEVTGDTSIFDLGVDSISALRLASILKDRGVGDATASKILQNPVINDLVRSLSRGASSAASEAFKESQQVLKAFGHRHISLACNELNVEPADIEYIAPCTPLQEGIISKSLVLEESGAYFNTFTLNLRLDVSETQLQNAWDTLIADEPVLRSVFLVTPNGPVQIALKNWNSTWMNTTAASSEQATAAVDSLHQSWLQDNRRHVLRPLQLVFAQGPGLCRLHVNIFHAIYDGMSLGLMLSRIASFMNGKDSTRGPSFLEAASLGPLMNLDHCRNFWTEHLKGWRPSATPLLATSPSGTTSTATRHLSSKSIDNVRTSQSVSLQSILLALWVSVLQKHHPSGLALGVIVAGRSLDLPGIEHTIGPLFNTLPFFNRTLYGQKWTSLIQKCQDFGASTLPFQHVPLQKIQKWCSKGQPLFDTLFTLQTSPEVSEEQQTLWAVSDEAMVPDYPLAIEVTLGSKGSMQVTLVAQGHIADAQALERLLDQLEENLESMSLDVEALISDAVEVPTAPEDEAPVIGAGSNETSDSVSLGTVAISIRDAIASLAGVDKKEIGPSTSILELGLDSIDVMKLSARLRSLKYDVPGSQIMRLQTIPKISAAAEASLAELKPTNDGLQVIQSKIWDDLNRQSFDVSQVQAVLPATPLQESMVAAMVESDFTLYFNHDVMKISENVDLDRLTSAWDKTIAALPILRTGFVAVEDPEMSAAYHQVVYKTVEVWRPPSEVTSLEHADKILQEAMQTAKLQEGRRDLFQLCIVSVGSDSYLVVSIAHALYDGWSLGLIFQELEKAYNGEVSSTTPSADALFRHTIGTSAANGEQFWANYLRDLTPTIVAALPNSPPTETVFRSKQLCSIDLANIHTFCKKQSISLQTFSQACWAMVLARLTGQLDVCFGVVMSGRDFEGAEDLVFPTMNTVAVRCILHGSASSFLRYLEDTMADIREHQTTPLRKLQAAAKAPPGGLFNSLFLLQKGAPRNDSGNLLESVRGLSATDYPVNVEAEVVDGSLIWRAACNAQFISETATADFMGSLDQMARFYLNTPDSDIASFSGTQVSICGMPPVQLTSEVPREQGPREDEHGDEHWSELSSTIRDVLSSVSGIPASEIRLDHTLYHLGLDSISALKVSSLLRKSSVHLTPRALIGATSISDMAEAATKQVAQSTPAPVPTAWTPPSSIALPELLASNAIPAANVDAVLPALPMQVYMLGAWENAQGKVFYPTFTHLLSHSCSKADIEHAWHATIASTPMLRTTFVYTQDATLPVLQVVLKAGRSAGVNLEVVRDDARDAWILRLHIHHALYDGFSLPAIMQKLAHAVVSGNEGATGEISGLSEWSRFCTSPAADDARASRKDFWTGYLGDCRRHGSTAGPLANHSVDRVSYLQKSAVQDAAAIRHSAARLGLGVQALFMAAYAKMLADTASSPPNVVFGMYLANRTSSEQQQLPDTYPRLNLVPLKVKIEDSLEEMAAQIQQDIGQMSINGRADVGLWEIAEWTGIQVTSFVNFLSSPGVVEEMPSKPLITEIEAPPSSTDQPLHQGVVQQGSMPVRNSLPVRNPPIRSLFAINIPLTILTPACYRYRGSDA